MMYGAKKVCRHFKNKIHLKNCCWPVTLTNQCSRTEAAEFYRNKMTDSAPEHGHAVQQLQEFILPLDERNDGLECANISGTLPQYSGPLMQQEHEKSKSPEHSSLHQTDLQELQDSADAEQQRRAEGKAQAKLENQQRRLALKEMRRYCSLAHS